jgi:hypothetical protein
VLFFFSIVIPIRQTTSNMQLSNGQSSVSSCSSYWTQTGAIQPRLLKELRTQNSTQVLSTELLSILSIDAATIPLSIITGIHTLCEGGTTGKSILSSVFEEAFNAIIKSLSQIHLWNTRILKLKTCLNLSRLFKDRVSALDKNKLRTIAEYCSLTLRDAVISEERFFSGLLFAVTCRNYGEVGVWIGSLDSAINSKSIVESPLDIFSNPLSCVIGFSRLCLLRGFILSNFDQETMESMFEIKYGNLSQHCLISLIYLAAFDVIKSFLAPPDHTLMAIEIMINSIRVFRKFIPAENASKSCIFSTSETIDDSMLDILDIIVTRWEIIYRISELFTEFLEIIDPRVMELCIIRIQEISWLKMFKYEMIRSLLKKNEVCVVLDRFPEVIDECYGMMREVEGRKAAGLIVDLLKRQGNKNVWLCFANQKDDWCLPLCSALIEEYSQHLRLAASEVILPIALSLEGNPTQKLLSCVQSLPQSRFKISGILGILKADRSINGTEEISVEGRILLESAIFHFDGAIRLEAFGYLCISKKVCRLFNVVDTCTYICV